MDLTTYWPKSLSHIGLPDDIASTYIVLAKISDDPVGEFGGVRMCFTALVPLALVDQVLTHVGGIGAEVSSEGPRPSVRAGDIYGTEFWINGRSREERFETLTPCWSTDNEKVLMPDNGLLMTYGLVPRIISPDSIAWDDPHGPVYDAIKVTPRTTYKDGKFVGEASISIRREYLEDFCSLKNCAAVQVFYEERRSIGDQIFTDLLKGSEGIEKDLPGRKLEMKFLRGDYHAEAPQMSSVWGSKLLLSPTSYPISEPPEPDLIWPDDTMPMTYERACKEWPNGYISDVILREYEGRVGFEIHPRSGSVSYGGRWSIGNSRRIGRSYLCLELKKFYEATPPSVINEWHGLAVSKSIAEEDLRQYGQKNIAERADELITSYLSLTGSLAALAERMGLGFTQKDIGSLDTQEVEYSGWWTNETLKILGNVAPIDMTRDEFLARAVPIVQLLELLKPAPLRNMALLFGVDNEIKQFGTLKLLATLIQLATIAKEQGHKLPIDAEHVVKLWKKEIVIDTLSSVFSVNQLRVVHSHRKSAEAEADIKRNVEALGINVGSMAAGWGGAVDIMYDRLSADLKGMSQLFKDVAG